MKITINTEVLDRKGLDLKQFLILLVGYYDVDYAQEFQSLVDSGLAEKNFYIPEVPILSDNTKDLIAEIFIDSDDRIVNSKIDFLELANKLISCYPKGVKPGTTYNWCDSPEKIAYKLKALIVVHNFEYTEEEAINATFEYVESFKENTRKMKLLKYFLLKTHAKDDIESDFMTIIENNRDEESTY